MPATEGKAKDAEDGENQENTQVVPVLSDWEFDATVVVDLLRICCAGENSLELGREYLGFFRDVYRTEMENHQLLPLLYLEIELWSVPASGTTNDKVEDAEVTLAREQQALHTLQDLVSRVHGIFKATPALSLPMDASASYADQGDKSRDERIAVHITKNRQLVAGALLLASIHHIGVDKSSGVVATPASELQEQAEHFATEAVKTFDLAHTDPKNSQTLALKQDASAWRDLVQSASKLDSAGNDGDLKEYAHTQELAAEIRRKLGRKVRPELQLGSLALVV